MSDKDNLELNPNELDQVTGGGGLIAPHAMKPSLTSDTALLMKEASLSSDAAMKLKGPPAPSLALATETAPAPATLLADAETVTAEPLDATRSKNDALFGRII